ncbi:MAG: AAA family ATPase [Patescibacteria group bacterium]
MKAKEGLGAPDNLPIGDVTEEARRFHDLASERRELREEFKKVTGKSWNKEKHEAGEREEIPQAENDLDVLQRAIEQGTIASLPTKEKVNPSDKRANQLSESLRELYTEAGGFGTEHVPALRAEVKFESKYKIVSEELAKLENLHDELDRQEFELLRLRRGNLNVADRKLLAQFKAVKDSIVAREARVRTDVESGPAARLHELEIYRESLQKYHFAETPSRAKYEDDIRQLWEEGKNVLITGPTGTGKTEMLVHLGKKLYQRSPEIIRSSERTGPADIFGKTLLKATPEGGTETFFQLGRYTAAIDAGVPLVVDEFNLLDLKVRFQLKELYNRKPGDEVVIQEDTGTPHRIKEGFAFAATANLKSDKHKERFDLDPAESRVFEMRRIEYLPKDELYDLALATLMDAQGKVRLSKTDAADRLKHLVEAAEMIQGAYLGVGDFFEDGGASKSKKWVLEKAVLDPGKVISMLSGWPAAEARGETFGIYLDQQLISFTNKEDFPEKDRNLLIKIFLSKGFFAGREATEFLTTIKPDKLRTWGLKEKRGAEERVDTPLRAQDVAFLDPFEKRKLELAKLGDEFLGEQFERVPYKEEGKEYKPGSLFKDKDGRVHTYVGMNAEGKPVLTPFETKKAKSESREEFVALVEREAENLQKFFGKDIDVPPVPDSITLEQYEKWKEMKFELHYLPAEDMSENANYPGWKKKPGKKFTPNGNGIEFMEEAKNSQNSLTPDTLQLTGAWVLVDTREKPAYKSGNQNYKDDKFTQVIKELRKANVIGEKGKKGSRFNITWEELQKPEVKQKLAEILEVNPDQIRLPRAIEWNFLGNAYYQQWGNTDTWEWFEEVYSGSGHLIGGDSDDGGLSSVDWGNAGSRGGDIGFRPLIVFS